MNTIGFSDDISEEDNLGLGRYYDGLTTFIRQCETPMTISIEGDWGTGKTTAMKMVEKRLQEKGKDNDPSLYHTIWFHTWAYDSLDLDDNLYILLLSKLLCKLDELSGKKKPMIRLSKAGIGKMFDTAEDAMSDLTSSTLVTWPFKKSMMAVSKQLISNLFSDDSSSVDVMENVREKIQKRIDDIIPDTNKGERLVIFVDDLDRLEPKVAVNLLEGLKNFLDCRKCVFVLAVDSSVVYRGVESKYGKEVRNEKKRQFFDKIIQVPFSLPVSRYDTKPYLRMLLGTDLGTDDGRDDKGAKYSYIERYEAAVRTYLKNNPRSVKRTVNLLKLYECILPGIDVSREPDRLYLFVILLIQMKDIKIYLDMVDNARKGDDIEKILGNEKSLLEIPLCDLLPSSEASCSQSDAELPAAALDSSVNDHLVLFLELLKGASQIKGIDGPSDVDSPEGDGSQKPPAEYRLDYDIELIRDFIKRLETDHSDVLHGNIVNTKYEVFNYCFPAEGQSNKTSAYRRAIQIHVKDSGTAANVSLYPDGEGKIEDPKNVPSLKDYIESRKLV